MTRSVRQVNRRAWFAKTPIAAPTKAHEDESIGWCLGAIELSLRRRCAEEAHAEIDRHFTADDSLTWESNVAELDLSPRLVNSLQRAEIMTAEDLRIAIGHNRLFEIQNVGPVEVQKCFKAIEDIGKLALDWVI